MEKLKSGKKIVFGRFSALLGGRENFAALPPDHPSRAREMADGRAEGIFFSVYKIYKDLMFSPRFIKGPRSRIGEDP
jgi:hypothetical protein